MVQKGILHFAHANGFPAGSYRKFFNALPSGYTVHAHHKFCHSERFPVSDNWHSQARELIDYLSQVAPNDKVVAVGHSFGAVISYIAACLEPARFSGLVMLDPPLVSGFSRYLVALAKRGRLMNKITPADLAEIRRRKWPKGTDLVAYFANKGLFKDMDRDCINDYVNAVIDEHEHGYELNFDPDIEARVFRTVPHNLHQYSGKLKCPATLITGSHTQVCLPLLRKAFIKDNHLTHMTASGGHMFPLENPKESADAVVTAINAMSGSGG
ncbi:alpha/beta fold hydrolase [Alteromonas oceanisediminis]|uniref:alpha/beta fold hydrolase n=1 Tax=Alteromonas oceanisediminis TaxID=2836180 RepID=UPI001BDB1402|nr:alpha/beta hydrolase [Alteromonas oceanisediminis]MBT0587249.1 alpha/beta hydrolase [Alteromonas oceanisediminis]